MNAVQTRMTEHLSSCMSAAPIDTSLTDNFINQNSQLQNYQPQSENLANLGTKYKSNMDSLVKMSSNPTSQTNLNIQSTSGTDVNTIKQAIGANGPSLTDLINSFNLAFNLEHNALILNIIKVLMVVYYILVHFLHI